MSSTSAQTCSTGSRAGGTTSFSSASGCRTCRPGRSFRSGAWWRGRWPGGRVFFVDSRNHPAAREGGYAEWAPETPPSRSRRRLRDGREFEIVKIFYPPDDLQAQLRALGWRAVVRGTATFFLHGLATPDDSSPATGPVGCPSHAELPGDRVRPAAGAEGSRVTRAAGRGGAPAGRCLRRLPQRHPLVGRGVRPGGRQASRPDAGTRSAAYPGTRDRRRGGCGRSRGARRRRRRSTGRLPVARLRAPARAATRGTSTSVPTDGRWGSGAPGGSPTTSSCRIRAASSTMPRWPSRRRRRTPAPA